MSLLVAPAALHARRAVARGALAPLADGLRHELMPLLAGSHDVPTEKAWLTRAGGRCDRDGSLLVYDPFDARHRCGRCGRELHGAEHDRFRLYWHHLWLAERALHAALLGALLDDAACTGLAHDLLGAYAARYLDYPNRDNVLGPSRPFFSTYLESIWLLQLVLAMDLLESSTGTPSTAALGARVRERLVAPSSELIASFDDGMSNRQVWNNAALIAAGRLLGNVGMVERAIAGASGLEAHLGQALLGDGSWYEGENYHLFAHRGLWYGVQLAECAGHRLPLSLERRFMAGFAAPFRTILPDLTYPSRRDSQYGVSVRQPRFAESCELGLARGDDDRLISMLARLYDPSIPRGEAGRASTSADVERNLPGTGLTRADLSWRTLLVARETLPPLRMLPLASDLLPDQGFGILRRDSGALYAALDYGHSGGGHGHPDRLNLLLVNGDARWFDDPGTGSYVDPSLHWYRSTLAHDAPLVDGKSQRRVHGTLVAFDDRGDAGWICAEAELADGLRVRRTLVVTDDYLIDRLEWEGEEPHELTLPIHGVDLVDGSGAPAERTPAPIAGGDGLEDGFSFLESTARVSPRESAPVRALAVRHTPSDARARLHGWVLAEPGTSWWSAAAPDVPTRTERVPLLLARHRGRSGRFVTVWSWKEAIADVELDRESVIVRYRDGRCDSHARTDQGWRIVSDERDARAELVLEGFAEARPETTADEEENVAAPPHPVALPAAYELREAHYRRSEASWRDAGEPGARVAIRMTERRALAIRVTVEPSHRAFVAPGGTNPLDNEPAAINGDGVQLYLEYGDAGGGWLLVPVGGTRGVHAQPVSGWERGLAVQGTWEPTALGYQLDLRVPLPAGPEIVSLDVLVNESAPGRERRRGQLVLSGAHGEFVYLRGDRHHSRRLLRFTIPDA